MATTTTNFGWDIPQSTDLVKDGATAIAALGQDIDTALIDLKGGATGQVLAKASGTDLDFSWVAVDPLTILDAKGDLISATAADTPARLAVGANNTVLTADSSTSTGLKWATPATGGLVFITSATVTAATTLTVSNVFTATYENYIMTYTGLTTSSGGNIGLQLATSGTPNSNASYDIGSWRVNYNAGTGNQGGQPLNQTSFQTIITDTSSTNASHGTFNFFAPFATKQTGMSTLNASANQMQVGSGIFKATTSFDGIRLTATQNMTGTFRFYGVANS